MLHRSSTSVIDLRTLEGRLGTGSLEIAGISIFQNPVRDSLTGSVCVVGIICGICRGIGWTIWQVRGELKPVGT